MVYRDELGNLYMVKRKGKYRWEIVKETDRKTIPIGFPSRRSQEICESLLRLHAEKRGWVKCG